MQKTMIFKGNGEIFSALYEAQDWLRANGYSYGSSNIDGPMGVIKGEGAYIPKWRNMSEEEQNKLDGVLHTSRQSSALLILRNASQAKDQ